MVLPKHLLLYNIWCKQTRLVKYPVNSKMLFSKSMWTHFIRLIFLNKFDVAHGVRSAPAPSLVLGYLVRKVSVDHCVNLGSLDIFSTPCPSLNAPLIWGIRWLNTIMNIFQRYRQRQTNTTTKLVTATPCHKNFSHKL